MFGRGKKKRTCPEGHPQEDSWEQCPFCAATGEGQKIEEDAEDESAGAVLVSSRKRAPARPLAGWIVALSGEQEGEDFRILAGHNVIGKGQRADIVIRDPYLDKRHAILEARGAGGGYSLRDLDTKHGTFVNGSRLEGARPVPLHDGDVLRVGNSELKLRTFEY